MTIAPDGLTAAAKRETEFHPEYAPGKPITAWNRRAATLEATVAEVNRLRDELDGLKEVLAARPF